MAVVQGIREKVHMPLYDSLSIEPKAQLGKDVKSGTMKFFVDVQGKTKLETNLQSASLLPHYNTFEARAMRVVISDLPPEFPENPTAKDEDYDVIGDKDQLFNENGDDVTPPANGVTANLEIGLDRLMELLHDAKESSDGSTELDADDEDVTLFKPNNSELTDNTAIQKIVDAGGVITLTTADLKGMIEDLDKKAPPKEQLDPNNGSGTVIGKLVYNSVTSLFVGEKVMISMPTWFFPAGAGPYSETGKFTTHGDPSPNSTFRFAEPIYIDKQQNFRVEIEIPDSETLKEIQQIYGPMNIWVVLDGFMTRDVQ
jgi:hypothetical protein